MWVATVFQSFGQEDGSIKVLKQNSSKKEDGV